jgi:predicted RND superfamily exporter protein
MQIMATGLSVDYAVYFAQKFMTVRGDGSGNSRMIIALGDTGSAVFLGGFTALCGESAMLFHCCTTVICATYTIGYGGAHVFNPLESLHTHQVWP